MANPLPNEKALYEQIKEEKITIAPDIWDLLYNRIGDDLSAINLSCQYYLGAGQPMPVHEAEKLLHYTRHIKDIVNKVTPSTQENLFFPEFINDMPLHPLIREMFTHYIGNDVYMINLVVGNSIDPKSPEALPLPAMEQILNHTRSIKEFMDKLRSATVQAKPLKAAVTDNPVTAGPPKPLTREELFLKIRGLLAEEFGIDKPEKIRPESRFREDLGLDSIDAIRVIMALETGFELEIPDDDADGIFSVEQVTDYIAKRLK